MRRTLGVCAAVLLLLLAPPVLSAGVRTADMLKPLNATVLGIFGEEDAGIPPAAVEKFQFALKKAGKKVEAIKEFKGRYQWSGDRSTTGGSSRFRSVPS